MRGWHCLIQINVVVGGHSVRHYQSPSGCGFTTRVRLRIMKRALPDDALQIVMRGEKEDAIAA